MNCLTEKASIMKRMKVNLWMALAVATWGCAGSMKAYAWPVAEKQAVEVVSQSIAEGQMAPDFTLKDLQGNDLALSSLRGKYVVLDFWGSWCGWCIKGIPDMKKYYDKYKDRMEILGIDCRDTEAKWKQPGREQTVWRARLSHQDCGRPPGQDCQDCGGRRPGFLHVSG